MQTTEPRLIEDWCGNLWCHYCLHNWNEHDGMGDCTHPDRRTLTGFCKCSENRVSARESARLHDLDDVIDELGLRADVETSPDSSFAEGENP